jgi:hypothetical protein
MNPQTQSAVRKRANYLIALSGIRQSAFAMLTPGLTDSTPRLPNSRLLNGYFTQGPLLPWGETEGLTSLLPKCIRSAQSTFS